MGPGSVSAGESGALLLGDDDDKTELRAGWERSAWDCSFDFEITRARSDTWLGFAIWSDAHGGESSLALHALDGRVRVVARGNAITELSREVGRDRIVGRRVKLHLRADESEVFAALDGEELLRAPQRPGGAVSGAELLEPSILVPHIHVAAGDRLVLHPTVCAPPATRTDEP